VRRVLMLALTVAFFAVAGSAGAVGKLTGVTPWTYDPYNGSLVESDWINHIG
jgi:hypothetical protein